MIIHITNHSTGPLTRRFAPGQSAGGHKRYVDKREIEMAKITIFFILALFISPTYATDISVKSVVLKYKDDITDKNKIVTRELHSLHEDEYWSKPYEVDIEVIVENIGKDKVKFINIKSELYHLLAPNVDQAPFPAMENELKTIRKEPTWVWSNNLGKKMIKELSPGEKQIIYFKNKAVRGDYYATDYSFRAFAVRVFASPRGRDDDYTNNVNQKIINYGD